MSAADIVDQASECSEAAMATDGSETMERPTKRTRIEIKPYNEIDLSQFALKDKGKGKNGHVAYPLLGNESIRFNLTHIDWLRAPFGFDVDSKFEKPSFLGGKEPEKVGASEGLCLRLELEPGQASFLTGLDKISEEAFAKIAEAKWNPLVAANALFKTSHCKVMVVLKGSDLTKLAIVVDGKVERGEGWQFLEPFIKRCNSFKFADVKLTVKVKKLWNVAGKAGLGLEATQIVLKPTERPTEVEAFGNDNDLLA